ncbi:Peroxisome biosynthesis protein PAS1 [Termitomyces sp. J132]|nr:Peroxisome biosynthesis protein PAS1 [Termitomyces sp. J132]
MPRRAHIHFVSLRSSLVNLPISIYGPLLERNVRPQHLAIHLKLVSTKKPNENVEAYVGWTGMASASSLTHFTSTQNPEKALETVEIDPQYAQGLGLSQGDLVEIGLLHDLPLAKSVATEPLTSDDWEIIEIHASHVESTLLSQVRVVKVGQEIDVWVMGRTRVRLRVVSMDPASRGDALLLTTNTEVSIAPKLHRTDRRADTNTREEEHVSRDNPAATRNEVNPKHVSHTLRVLPHGVARVTLPDYPGPEFVGYISPLTYQKLCHPTKYEGGDYIYCGKFAFKRLLPPSEPPSSSTPALPPPPPPVPRVIVPASSGKDTSLTDNVQSEDVVFVGPLSGVPDSHIVFPAAPRGVEDWDLVVLSVSDDTSTQSVKVNVQLTCTASPPSQTTWKTTLAGVDHILENATNFCLRKFISHVYADAVHGVSALLLTGRSGTGKTSIAQHVAKNIQEDLRTYTLLVDVSRYTELPISTVKSLLQYWFDKAIWHKPSILILDNLDKLVGTEVEHADSFRTRHITELFLSLYSSSSRTAPRNSRGLLLLATATSTASLHPLVNSAHIFQEEIKVKPPNNDARRDVDGRLAAAQDIRLDTASPLNYTALATQTEGYSVIDLQDLVGRAIHQVAIRAADGKQPAVLSSADFTAAQVNFIPHSLRDVKLQKSDIAWSDIGGLHETRRILRETLEWPTKYGPIFAQSPLRLRSGRPDLIDSALLRPGRLDKSLLCGMPDTKERQEARCHSKQRNTPFYQRVLISPSVDWEEVAAATGGFSGADLQALVYNAHLDVIHTSLHASSDKKETEAFIDEDPINFKTIGGVSNSKTHSRAEQSALEKRVIIADEIRTRYAASRFSVVNSNLPQHEIAAEHLHRVIKTMRPSVSPEEHRRLDRIYRAFVSDRSGDLTAPPEVGGVGHRVSLG